MESSTLLAWPISIEPYFLLSKVKGELSLEVHILNFNREIYGEEIQVNFKRRIRDEIRFTSPAQLIDRIQKDIQWAQENVFRKSESPH
jgi:riboflavin kinase/FMN adenylyltransferase